MNIILEDGKYEYHCKDGEQYALRNGEPWRDLTGDNFIYYMAERIEQLERQRDKLLALLEMVCSKAHRGTVWLDIEEVDNIYAAISSVKEKQCK